MESAEEMEILTGNHLESKQARKTMVTGIRPQNSESPASLRSDLTVKRQVKRCLSMLLSLPATP